MEVLYFCEFCKQPVYDQFGTGKFCSISCASKWSQTPQQFICDICGKELNTSKSGYTLHRTACKKRRDKQIAEEKLWNDSPHYCEKCGQQITIKYGSGRFCSQSCAKTREHSEDTKRKISQSVKMHAPNTNVAYMTYQKSIELHNAYLLDPNTCKICGKALTWEQRHHKTCGSKECIHTSSYNALLLTKSKSTKQWGGIRQGAGYGKSGQYKGIHCDSTWELAWVIYALDHNIKFERNKIGYPYTYKEKEHLYYPDFLLEDGSLIEIKGYMSELVEVKIAAVTDKSIKLICRNEILPILDYVKNSYQYINLYELYDDTDQKQILFNRIEKQYKNYLYLAQNKRLILSADIDFSVRGWLSKVMKVTGLSKQRCKTLCKTLKLKC